MTQGVSGREMFSAREVTVLRHHFKNGQSLANDEIERLLWTAEFALDELEHQLRKDVPSPESLKVARDARVDVLDRVLEEDSEGKGESSGA